MFRRVTNGAPKIAWGVAGGALFVSAIVHSQIALADSGADDVANRAWQSGAIQHAQRMRGFHDRERSQQPTPPFIPQFEAGRDSSGRIASFQPGGATQTSHNAFFRDIGANGRTCFTCHQPQDAWAVSASHVQERFYFSGGTDPIFRLVDGAVCPSADVSSYDAKLRAYDLLLAKGLIRVGLPMPANTQFSVAHVDDPHGCNTSPTTGLSSPTSGIVSVYRRPLPSANLGFLATIMWDGREPSLASQAVDATLGHAQADAPPSPKQVAEIVNFESGVFTAQFYDKSAHWLTEEQGKGGPLALQGEHANFYIGVNDPLGLNPKHIPFTSNIFDIYKAWESLPSGTTEHLARLAVARGERLFNDTPINITGVGGLNDALGQPSIPGFCGTCHDSPNVGNHSVTAPLNIGVANAGANSPAALDIADLPVFTLKCVAGPLAGQTFTVTDPGRALISGKCADIGKVKGPILRGLAARAPYFHNGSAETLMDVIDFYNVRFSLNFTDQQKRDLEAFLRTL